MTIETVAKKRSFSFAQLFSVWLLLGFADQVLARSHSKEVIIPISIEWPPYQYTDSTGKYIGTDVSLLRAVLDEMGYTMSFRDSIPLKRLTKNNKDLGFNTNLAATFTQERAKNHYFSIPYREERVAIYYTDEKFDDVTSMEEFFKRANSGVTNLAAFYGKEFEVLKVKYSAKITHIETAARRLKQLVAGRIDFIVSDVDSTDLQLTEGGITHVKRTSFYVSQENVRYMFTKSAFNQEFVEHFNKVLKEKLAQQNVE